MKDDKLEKIRNAERPKTKKQVCAFLGLAGYYRRFTPAFSDVAVPLTDLTKRVAQHTLTLIGHLFYRAMHQIQVLGQRYNKGTKMVCSL